MIKEGKRVNCEHRDGGSCGLWNATLISSLHTLKTFQTQHPNLAQCIGRVVVSNSARSARGSTESCPRQEYPQAPAHAGGPLAGVELDRKSPGRQVTMSVTKEANSPLGYTGMEVVSRMMEMIFPLSPALVKSHVEFCVQCWAGSPAEKRCELAGKHPLKGHGDDWRFGAAFISGEAEAVRAEDSRFERCLFHCVKIHSGMNKEDRLFTVVSSQRTSGYKLK